MIVSRAAALAAVVTISAAATTAVATTASAQDSAVALPPAAPAAPDSVIAASVARAPDRLVVDRVVAVVGNRPVLASQVEEQLFTLLSQPSAPTPHTPADTAALRRQIVQEIMDEELMVQEAQRDTSIKVTDQEVDEGVEQQVKNIRSKFTTELDFRSELRKAGFQTPEEYRRYVADQQRRSFLQSRLMDKLREAGKLKSVPPTEKEMRAYFDAQRSQLGQRPATLSFKQIIVAPKPTNAAKAKARALADSIVLELRRGADFATAAKRFSQDSATKEQGGSLGWTRRGSWVAEFERAAFALRPGVVSEPVESPFGYHIIQVERTQPAEVLARHILITPELTAANVDSARATAQRLRTLIEAGASFDSLQAIYHDPTEEREAPEVPLSKLPETYSQAIGPADSGTVVPIFALPGPAGHEKFAVLKVTARRPEGEVRFEDVRDKVRDRLAEQLAVRRYLDRLRNSTYTEIRTS